ncbi:unnamed protein product [Parnassius apollo]|uniref:(apollo) hypothetical protein n=1 Tax=Parnassius apollo TaxID=110799 RepID=A0A8S3W3X6_PARAO|nr:unnamed protein product [Parnassius apollo]
MSQCNTSGTRSAPAQRFPSPSRAPDGESSVSVTQRIEIPVEAHAEVSNVSETALLVSLNEHRIDPERATTQTNTQMSMSDLVRSNNNGITWKEQEKSEEWKLVQRKKYRNHFNSQKGTCIDLEQKFRAADILIPLFINNVHVDTFCIYLYLRKRRQLTVLGYIKFSRKNKQ